MTSMRADRVAMIGATLLICIDAGAATAQMAPPAPPVPVASDTVKKAVNEATFGMPVPKASRCSA